MKKIFVLTILGIIVFFQSLEAQNARQFFKVGEDFLENGKYEASIEQLSKAIDLDPDYDKAFELRARAFEKTGNYEAAREDYEKLNIFDEKNESYYYDGARMSYALKDYQDALSKLNKAMDKKKSYLEAMQLSVNTLIELGNYTEAVKIAEDVLKKKDSDINYYNLGRAKELSGAWNEAIEAFHEAIKKNRNFYEAHTRLADLQRRTLKLQTALATANKVVAMNKEYLPVYKVRSSIYADMMNYSAAINDISTILLMQPENKDMYFLRGKYYQDYAQHINAISDFTKVISLDSANVEAWSKRAFSYEQIMKFKEAVKDYEMLTIIAEDSDKAEELLAVAKERLFELNRENDKPVLRLVNPEEYENRELRIPRSESIIPIVGIVNDESDISRIMVNELSVSFKKEKEKIEFMTSVDITGLNQLKVEVTDVYNNTELAFYDITRTEIDPPIIRILAPYASDNNVIWLESDNPYIYVEGSVEDESLIESIFIDDVIASYIPQHKNPEFQARINIQNKNSFKVKAVDSYGNESLSTFSINRDAAELMAENPMGKTWVVFIENSNYRSFASLEGPVRDITLMKSALAKYTIHNFIHKRDMTKQEMEKFFAIELRDLLKSNRVNSLLLWYAGHGKFVNETGYWVPVDAKRDDEFTYFNINALKASMQSYPEHLDHKLIITDACESGPSFYQAMRSDMEEMKDCNDPETVKLKSSQVFSSAGYELAVDNSQFTRTFANVLANNENSCIPIEQIVITVTDAVVNSNQQKPQFGKISGLEDENGTFFFIAK